MTQPLRRNLPALLPLAMVIAAAVPAKAQPGSTDQAAGRAQATVVQALRAVPLADLSFGAIVVGGAGDGVVTIAPVQSQASYGGSVRPSCGGNSNCVPHAASFAVYGEEGRIYRVSLPAQVLASGDRTDRVLLVQNLAMRSRNQPATSNGGRLDQHGEDRFEIGGTLHVPSGTKPDIFRADLPVTVSYD